jgi:hypothetical protein
MEPVQYSGYVLVRFHPLLRAQELRWLCLLMSTQKLCTAFAFDRHFADSTKHDDSKYLPCFRTRICPYGNTFQPIIFGDLEIAMTYFSLIANHHLNKDSLTTEHPTSCWNDRA